MESRCWEGRQLSYEVLHEIEIATELQHRMLPDGMVGGEERAEAQTGHEQVSWLVMMISDSTS